MTNCGSNTNAWREAHSRLYEYYKSYAKELPDTLEEMAPLFAAVAHGCLAGHHQEALDAVYARRIQRWDKTFTKKKLGAFGTDLAALSGFFDPPWRQPVATLDKMWQSWILAEAGFDLRALGQLAEAIQPMQAGLEAMIARKDWKQSAASASNLSELYLTIGDLAQALKFAQQSVELADHSGDPFLRMVNRVTLADALHQAGSLPEAEAPSREAEEMQKQRQPEFPLLYSMQGFRYCDLLLSQGKYQEVQSRAGQTLEWVTTQHLLLDIALDNLSLGRAYLQEATLTLPSPLRSTPSKARSQGDGARSAGESVNTAATHLQRAVDGLRQAGQQQYIPLGLLARAELHLFTGDFTRAQNDLDEAFTIATRGGMRLFEADCHLQYARLYLAHLSLRGVHAARERSATESKNGTTKQSPADATEIASQTTLAIPRGRYAVTDDKLKAQAREHLTRARALIEQTGYHRRDEEVKEIEKMINDQ